MEIKRIEEIATKIIESRCDRWAEDAICRAGFAPSASFPEYEGWKEYLDREVNRQLTNLRKK